MKKLLALLLALIMVLSFAACGNSNGETKTSEPPATSNTDDKNTANNPSTENTDENKEAAEGSVRDGAYVPSDETLYVACKGNPTGICFLTVNAVSYNNPTLSSMYDRLLRFDYDTNSVVPMLATEWEYIDDTHVRFHLRDDVYSHAGDHFTASDVIYTVTTGKESGLLSNYYEMFNLEECKVEDEYTVVLATNNVEPYFLYNMSNTPLSMVVEASVEKSGGLEAQSKFPDACTGPYKFVEWSDGSYIKLERNEEYWDGPAYYKDVEIRIITDASARVMNLESGDVDIALDPDTNQVAILDGNEAFQIINAPTSNVTTMYLNCTKAPFDDVNVRRAIALALNYEANVAIAAGGYGTAVDSFLPGRNGAYVSPADGGYETNFRYDVEAAKAALAESGYPDGFSFTLIYAENAIFSSYGELIQNQLGQIGIDVKLESMASSVFYERCSAGDFDAQIVNSSNPDPAIQLRYFDKRIDFKTMRGGCGYVGGSDELLALIDEAKITLDADRSRELYTQIQAIIADECPEIPLYSPTKVCAADSDIKNINVCYFGDINWSRAYK